MLAEQIYLSFSTSTFRSLQVLSKALGSLVRIWIGIGPMDTRELERCETTAVVNDEGVWVGIASLLLACWV